MDRLFSGLLVVPLETLLRRKFWQVLAVVFQGWKVLCEGSRLGNVGFVRLSIGRGRFQCARSRLLVVVLRLGTGWFAKKGENGHEIN